jgi:hypothetical protein
VCAVFVLVTDPACARARACRFRFCNRPRARAGIIYSEVFFPVQAVFSPIASLCYIHCATTTLCVCYHHHGKLVSFLFLMRAHTLLPPSPRARKKIFTYFIFQDQQRGFRDRSPLHRDKVRKKILLFDRICKRKRKEKVFLFCFRLFIYFVCVCVCVCRIHLLRLCVAFTVEKPLQESKI